MAVAPLSACHATCHMPHDDVILNYFQILRQRPSSWHSCCLCGNGSSDKTVHSTAYTTNNQTHIQTHTHTQTLTHTHTQTPHYAWTNWLHFAFIRVKHFHPLVAIICMIWGKRIVPFLFLYLLPNLFHFSAFIFSFFCFWVTGIWIRGSLCAPSTSFFP